MMLRSMALFLLLKLIGGRSDMVTIYTTLIVRGYKTICDVPKVIREDVRTQLRQLELPQLADVTCVDDSQV